MNSDRLNNWLTLVANMGVLLGLVVLVYEVRQNTQALRNETDVAIYSLGAELGNVVIDNPDVAALMIQARDAGLNSLSPADQFRLSILYSGLVDRLELQHRLYTRNDVELDPDSIVFPADVLSVPAFRNWWEQNKQIYHPDFVPFFDRMIRDNSE